MPSTSLRTAIERIVVGLVLLLICQTWALDGLLRSYFVAGASMACTLLGEHRQVVCGDCGFAFDCDSSFQPVSSRAVCPNCGYAENDLESLPDLYGDRVLIDRSAFLFRAPRRWEVVAFQSPQPNGELAVKRAVGLPGETVEIRHGDIYIDGQIVRKPLALQRAMAVTVEESNFVSKSLPPRWKGENAATRWELDSTETGTRRFACDAPTGGIDWLVYHHARRLPGAEGSVESTPIEDTLTYNQNRPRRVEDVHAVRDLMLSFDLTITGSGTFSIRATDGQNTFRVVLQPEHNRFAVHQNDTPLKVGDDNIAVREGMRIEVSLVDRQFLLAFDGREVVKCPLAEATGDPRGTTEPFAVGAEAVSVVVSNSRIVRDIYYSDPIGKLPYGWGGSPATLGSDSYYVLGDNSPISEDSRTWGRTSQIVSNSLLGKPLAVIFPAQSCQPFGRRFQIPDLRRIRYIR